VQSAGKKEPGKYMTSSLTIHAPATSIAGLGVTAERKRFRLTADCIPKLSEFKYKDYSRFVVNCKFR
jgi:hypothetical protein